MKTGNDMTLCVGGADSEVWKPIVGFEGIYEISILGVRNSKTGRILKPGINLRGCPHVNLYICGKRTTHTVSVLVANAFLPPKGPTDTVVRHLNDDPADNRIENLAWGTHSDNMLDAIRNGKWCAKKGVSHGMAKLMEDDVREIRSLYATGNFTKRELGLRFGVTDVTIGLIVRRQHWKHIA
jgi:hypothetical protein